MRPTAGASQLCAKDGVWQGLFLPGLAGAGPESDNMNRASACRLLTLGGSAVTNIHVW